MQIYTKNIEIPNFGATIFQFSVYLFMNYIHTNSYNKYFNKNKSDMNDTNTNQNQSKRPSRKGNLNPMANRHHSMQSRQKMSQSHKDYWSKIRQQQAPSGMTMAEFLGMNQNLDIKGYIKSLMDKEGLIREIIREEIKKLM